MNRPPSSIQNHQNIWEDVELLFRGEDYSRRLIEEIRRAKRSIRIESYIFDLDEVGLEVLRELERASDRGVLIRVLVDAIGSPDWWKARLVQLEKQGVVVRIFGRPRELFASAWKKLRVGKPLQALQTLRKLQFRNHRKLAIFDSELALVGSANIGRKFNRWRETTALLRGEGVLALKRSFVRCWRLATREKVPDEAIRADRLLGLRQNFTLKERKAVNRRYIENILLSERRIWITTAYFHPRTKFLLALLYQIRNGIDVRILCPKTSDIRWFPWLSRAIYSSLVASGARVFEYTEEMLHAKTSLFDHHAMVGSTNLNHRSFMHDLELDVVLYDSRSLGKLEHQFLEDCRSADEISRKQVRHFAPLAHLVAILLSPIRRWL